MRRRARGVVDAGSGAASFVKDGDTKVGALLEKEGASVIRFARLEVGEGIEKEEEDFAAEVQKQLGS